MILTLKRRLEQNDDVTMYEAANIPESVRYMRLQPNYFDTPSGKRLLVAIQGPTWHEQKGVADMADALRAVHARVHRILPE